jgi:hypothetical protein
VRSGSGEVAIARAARSRIDAPNAAPIAAPEAMGELPAARVTSATPSAISDPPIAGLCGRRMSTPVDSTPSSDPPTIASSRLSEPAPAPVASAGPIQ